MSLSAAAIRLLADKGLSASDIAEVAESLGVKERSAGAIRQQEYRARQKAKAASDATSDVTPLRNECDAPHAHVVIPTSSSLRSEEALPPPTPKGVVAPPPAPRTPNGTRLPEGWSPNADNPAYLAKLGLTAEEGDVELEKFSDYWRRVPGAKGRSLDWNLNWKGWLRRAADDRKSRSPGGPNGQRPHNQPGSAASRSEDRMRRIIAGSEVAARVGGYDFSG